MKSKRFCIYTMTAVLLPALFSTAKADSGSCNDIHLMTRMINARSASELNSLFNQSTKSDRAAAVYNFRNYELRGNDVNAARHLFSELPSDDRAYQVWMTMGDSLCDGESIQEMKLLGAYGDRFPRLLSKAIFDFPDGMNKYVQVLMLASNDPHSHLAVYAKKVCLGRRKAFVLAVSDLKATKWFNSHVINLSNCSIIDFPEADD